MRKLSKRRQKVSNSLADGDTDFPVSLGTSLIKATTSHRQQMAELIWLQSRGLRRRAARDSCLLESWSIIQLRHQNSTVSDDHNFTNLSLPQFSDSIAGVSVHLAMFPIARRPDLFQRSCRVVLLDLAPILATRWFPCIG